MKEKTTPELLEFFKQLKNNLFEIEMSDPVLGTKMRKIKNHVDGLIVMLEKN